MDYICKPDWNMTWFFIILLCLFMSITHEHKMSVGLGTSNPVNNYNSVQNWIKSRHWRLCITPADGHCLIYAIVLSWKHQLPGNCPSYEDIRSSIYIETIKNCDKYRHFITDNQQLTLIKELQQYLLNKNYNLSLCDVLPYIIANAYSIEIVIINFTQGSQVIHIQPDGLSTAALVIHLQNEHYSGVQLPSSLYEQSKSLVVHNLPQTSQITYSAEELKSYNKSSLHLKRCTRKILFKLFLWLPKASVTSALQNNIPVRISERQQSFRKIATSKSHTQLIQVSKQQLSRKKSQLTLACVNVHSLRNKYDDFVDHVISQDLDICLICETWLTDNDDVILANATPVNYTIHSCPRISGRVGGGLALLVKKTFQVINIIKSNACSFEATTWTISDKRQSIMIVGLYRPPYSDGNRYTLNTFIQEFSDFLENVIMNNGLPHYHGRILTSMLITTLTL